MRATKARMRSRATFAGPGYNPKAINLRAKPPPFAEKKFHELGQDATTIQNIATTTTPAHSGFSSLNLISYGDSMSTRNGNKVLLDSISLRGRCIVDKNSDPSFANVVSTTTIFRIVVFLDTQCNGGSPTIDEFFDTQLVSQDAFDCYNSLHNTGRFKTLLDKRVTVQPGPCFMDNTPTPDTVACPGGETEFSFHLKNLRIPIMFSDGYDYIQSVRTNNIGMFFLTVGGGGSDTKTQRRVAWRSRVRFYDY